MCMSKTELQYLSIFGISNFRNFPVYYIILFDKEIKKYFLRALQNTISLSQAIMHAYEHVENDCHPLPL